MSELSKFAATAIRDVSDEGFIALALQRLGWQVIQRATDIDGIKDSIEAYPNLYVVASDDFRGIDTLQIPTMLVIRGRVEPLISGATEVPRADHELHAMLLAQNQESKIETYDFAPLESPTDLFLSTGRNIGLTTTALNFAAELSEQGERVLFIDAHMHNPSMSNLTGLNGIRGAVKITSFGVAVSEVTSLNDLHALSGEANNFDRIIIDGGEALINERISNGRRIEDVVLIWALRSTNQLHLASQSHNARSKRIEELKKILPSIARIEKVRHLVFAQEVMSKKSTDELIASMEGITGLEASLLPLDNRALSTLRRDTSPLLISAPKTLLRRAILNHLERSVIESKSLTR